MGQLPPGSPELTPPDPLPPNTPELPPPDPIPDEPEDAPINSRMLTASRASAFVEMEIG